MKFRIQYAGLGALALLASTGANAQQAGEIRLYAGDPVAQSGVSLMSWGSGEAKESDEHVLIGSKSIKITTHGNYQGARLVYSNPLSLKAAMDDKAAYLQFMLVLPTKESTGRMGSDYGGGMAGMMGRGRMGASGGPSGRGEGGSAPGDSGGSARMIKPKALSSLRVVLVTTENKRVETLLDLDTAVQRDDWSTLAIPVVALTGLKDTSGEIKEIQIFGDSPATLYLGEARIVRDETPIRIDDLPDQTVPLNFDVPFSASADAGVTPLKYEWDFDASDGISVDAVGKSVKHRYRKRPEDAQHNAAPITVTLTVRDAYGIKQPATRTMKVYVTL